MSAPFAPAVCFWVRPGVRPTVVALAALDAAFPAECPRLACFSGADLPAGWACIAEASTPQQALLAASRRWPEREIVLVWAEAILPAAAYLRLRAAAAASPESDVVSTATPALPPLDPMPRSSLSPQQRDAHCWRHGEPRALPCRLWSPALSWWRPAPPEVFERLADGIVPEPLAGALTSALYVDAPGFATADAAPPLPIAALRARAPDPRLAATLPGLDGKPVVLHVLHGWGGGAWRFVGDLQAADDERHHLVLVAHGDWRSKQHGQSLSLYGRLDDEPLERWTLVAPIDASAIGSPEYRAILDHIQRRWNVGAVLVSSLIGHSLDALRTGLPTAVCTHDYYPLWPRLHARFDDADAAFDEAALEAVLQDGADLPFASRDVLYWRRLRQAYLDALAAADARLIAPTEGVKRNQIAMCPSLAERCWSIIPHGQAPLPRAERAIAARDDRKLRVLVPGRIQGDKGEHLLADLITDLPEHVELVLLGAGASGQRFLGTGNVHLLRDYRLAELPRLVEDLQPDLALLPSTVPETWSYTLSEMWQLGLPVLATDLGSFRERITDGVDGLLSAPDAGSVRDRLREIAGDPAAHARLAQLQPPALTTPGSMAAAWRSALPALMPAGLALDAVTPETGAVLAARARLHALASELAEVQTQVAMQRAELDRRAEWATDLERQLREHTADKTHDHPEAEHLASQLRESDECREALVAELRLSASREAELRRQMGEIEHELRSAHTLYENDTADLARQRDVAIAQRDSAERQVQSFLRSRSWRVTRPIRVLHRALSSLHARLAYRAHRTRAIVTRTLTSLRVRGWRHTVRRIRQEFAPRQNTGAHAPRPADDGAELALPGSASPVASIVVPVYNQVDFTLACLRSLAASGDRTAFEVIVVDDGSSDATARLLPEISGLRYHRNARNLGFVGACNAGAALARGEFLVFLNNDTTVHPGWLDALLATFRAHPDTGLAGAKLVYPDGRLQEAGGIVFADGSGWNYGRFEDPADPRFNFVRESDYCSGAAIAIRRELFADLGGFDQRYAPAYYEDTDLAMQVRERGLRVRYQPASVVTHYEGVTAGTDTGSGVKAHQLINQRIFLARWSDRLAADHAPPGTSPTHAAQCRSRRQALVIDASTPTPDRDSGSLRMVNLMRLLIEEGCAVSFFADNHAHDGAYTEALQQLGVEVWHQPWLGNVARWFADHGKRFDTILVSRHYVASSYLPLIRQFAPRARLVFDTVDLHYLREQRAAELAGSAIMARNARATRDKELRLIREADLTLVVSTAERELLVREMPQARVEVLSNVHAIAGCRRGFDEREDLVFVGGFRHPPNVDAMRWFVADILPRVRERLPSIRLHIIGADAPESIQRLADAPGVAFHGYVADLDPYMDGCRVAIAPLRYGAGVKGKVNLSMAHGQPVVATACAVEGMFLSPGEDVLTAETAEDFAAAIVRLHGDRELWEQLSAQGLENVRRHFSFEAARPALRRVLDRLPPRKTGFSALARAARD